ncbi:salicylic acid-binding protein 2-like isoform X2 [Quercus lobata]|uniref:salicylic acid-binding protein 2-like isoform X2 n=1 Tax=Quercus lobata TaxID=97700 RepID=UPI0012492497|nr:salicylic acid-binding protein 2-like isoform X2 [Quercus lobata]
MSTKEEPPRTGKHFVLIHGACLGAWSWYKLETLLKSSGHNVTALDLGASGINPLQANDLQSSSDYFKPLRDFMEALPFHERVILVGHSYGGYAISQAMEYYPSKISVAVFATALMPGPTLNYSTLKQMSMSQEVPQLDNHYTYDQGPNNPPTTKIFGPLSSASYLFPLSPIEDLTLAALLLRPLRLFSDEDLSKQLMLSTKKYGSVKKVFIIAEKDKAIKRDFQLWMIERNPPSDVVEIKGSDHMVMMSKTIELWSHLQGIAEKYS